MMQLKAKGEYFCTLRSINCVAVAQVGYDWNAETLVDSMSPVISVSVPIVDISI